MFRNATQNPGELLDSYCTRLRRLAQTCEFANEDEEIKSHIVVSCSSSRLRRRALREDINLKDLLAYGRGLEMFFSFFIRLLSFKHIHHNHIHVVSDKAGDPASSNELFKRSPQY